MCPVCTASPKESHQRKGDPTRCVPPLRCGQPAVLVRGARCGTRYALRASLEQPQRVSSRSTGAPTPAPPHALRSSAHREGDPRIGHPHGPSLRSAPPAQRVALAPARGGRAKQRPVWLVRLSTPLLAAPAAGRLWGGMGVEAPMLRELTRRSCPNGAAKQRSEFCGAPRNRPAAGLPRSKAQGSQTGGRLSFGYFSLAKQRTSTSAAGPRPGFRTKTKHAQTSIGSAQTAGGNSKTTKNNGCQHLIDRRQQPK